MDACLRCLPITWMHCAAKLRCLAADRKKTRSKNTWVLPRARAHSIPKYSLECLLFYFWHSAECITCYLPSAKIFSCPLQSHYSLRRKTTTDVLLFFSLRTHAQMIRKPIIDQTAENGHCPRCPGFPYLFQTVLKSRWKSLERRSWGSPPSRNFIFLTSRKNERTFVRCRPSSGWTFSRL